MIDRTALLGLALAVALQCPSASAQSAAADKLLRAYPDSLARVENGALVWRDGTRMPVSGAVNGKTFERMLESPSIGDMFAIPYPKGRMTAPPAADPGRVRYAPLFDKMYGDCTKGGAEKNLVTVPWLPAHGGGGVRVTRINSVDKAVAAASAELERLPVETIRKFLLPPAGAYNCRPIAGTNRVSAHGWGIAIDIATRNSDYWRWSKNRVYRNRIPLEIVEIFERHGFIWGGKWKSFDTMHFEYRPELLLD